MENPQAMPTGNQPQQQGGGGDQMQQVMQMVQQMLEQGAQPMDVAVELLNSQVPPEAIMEVFTQMGMQPEEAQATIQEAMQGGGEQQQGPGEEMMEGQASNPQEESAEQMPEGMSPEDMAAMEQMSGEEQQMVEQPSDEQLAMAFGGPNYDLIEKAFGGTADLNVNSSTYVQDRQANFINALKKNTLMTQASKQIFDDGANKMKYGGDMLPKADLGDVGKYKTKDEYELAIYRYNADPNNKTKLDFNTEIGKWKEPAKTTDQVIPGQPKYNIIYNYAPPSAYGTSNLARLWNNSGRGPGTVKINGKDVPANFNYSDLFDPGKGTGTVDGRTWSVTGAEDIKGGIFGKKVVGKKYNIAWNQAPTALGPDGKPIVNTTPGAVPGAVPGANPGNAPAYTQVVGNKTLNFDALGNVIPEGPALKPSKYNPNVMVTDDQAKEEDVNYAKYQSDFKSKTYDPITGKFTDLTTDRGAKTDLWENKTVYSEKNPGAMDATQIKAIQATLGIPETGTWDASLTKAITDYQTKNKLGADGTIGENTGKMLAADYKKNTAIQKITSSNPNTALANQYQNFTQFDRQNNMNNAIKKEKDAQAEILKNTRADELKAADAAFAERSGWHRMLHSKPSDKVADYEKELAADKADEADKLAKKNAKLEAKKKREAFENKYMPEQAFGGVPMNDLQKAAQTILMAFGGTMPKFEEAGSTSEIEVRNKKGKLNVDWGAATDLIKEKVDWTTKFFNEAEQRAQDREREGLYSAVNAPQNELSNQGWDQFGNFMGGTDVGAQVQNLTNTSQSMTGPVYELGGRTYALGGQYDLSDEEVELLKSHGVNIQKS